MKPVNVALIGCGAVAEHYYCPALKKLSNRGAVNLKAVFDTSKARAEKLSRQFPEAIVVEEIAQLKDIDLAIIATPVAAHAEQSIKALNQGSSVLCEKPMAPTSIQCQAMLDATGSKLLAVGHFRRQFPAALAIKEILTGDLLGKARAFTFSEGSPFQWPAATGSLFKKEEAGGGVFMDLGVHLLDLALWFFGDVQSQKYEDDAMGGVEANCRLQLKFKNDISGNVRLSRDWFLDNKYIIDCEKGSISWDITQATNIEVISGDTNAMKSIDELRGRVCLPSPDEPDHLCAFFNQLNAVIQSVAENRVCETVVTGAEAMKAMRLIEACYEKAQLMPMPWLNDVELKRAQLLKGVG